MDNLKSIIESLLFVSEQPLSVERLKNVLGLAAVGDIRTALNQLIDDYENRKGGFHIREVAGGYQFRTRTEHTAWVTKLIQPKPPRISKAALETLAIIAYKQPIIRSDVEHIRGVDCGGVIRALLERNLIRVLGRKEIPGRPLIYATTKHFLEVFDLKDLKDLPTPKEIEEMGQALADRSDLVLEEDDRHEASDEPDAQPAATLAAEAANEHEERPDDMPDSALPVSLEADKDDDDAPVP